MDTTSAKLRINGETCGVEVTLYDTLLTVLRDKMQLTGTKRGCNQGVCGACTVLLDGRGIKSCTTLAASCDGGTVTTIEGLSNGDDLHPMQAAFREHHALQCGFCTPGMIMAAVDLVGRKGTALDEDTIRKGLEGNICRCTGYHNIVKAVGAGAQAMGGMKQAAE